MLIEVMHAAAVLSAYEAAAVHTTPTALGILGVGFRSELAPHSTQNPNPSS